MKPRLTCAEEPPVADRGKHAGPADACQVHASGSRADRPGAVRRAGSR